MNNLQYLLKEVNLIREKYQHRKNAEECYNIFTTLLKANNEVDLHSRFISTLLDPIGPHKMERLPLNLFLKSINSNLDFGDAVEVIPNNKCKAEYKEIDILVRDAKNKTAIIIENKINALDSNHEDRGQLEGYYQTVISDGYPKDKIEVYYLTTDRHEPSENSICTNNKTPDLRDKVRCIDYSLEIVNWLESLVKETFAKPGLRETIIMYIKLIKDMTGDLNVDERIELMSVVGKNDDNLSSAKLLVSNFNHICWHTIFDFNQEMIQALEKEGYTKIEACDKDDITTIVHGGPIQKSKVDVFYHIIDNNGITWQLVCSSGDINGFYLGVKPEDNKGCSKDVMEKIFQFGKENDFQSQDGWCFWQYLKDMNAPYLYFWNFMRNDTQTFDLISPTKRKQIIDKIVQTICHVTDSFAEFIK